LSRVDDAHSPHFQPHDRNVVSPPHGMRLLAGAGALALLVLLATLAGARAAADYPNATNATKPGATTAEVAAETAATTVATALAAAEMVAAAVTVAANAAAADTIADTAETDAAVLRNATDAANATTPEEAGGLPLVRRPVC